MNTPTQLELAPADTRKRLNAPCRKMLRAFLQQWHATGKRLFSDEIMAAIININRLLPFVVTRDHVKLQRRLADLPLSRHHFSQADVALLREYGYTPQKLDGSPDPDAGAAPPDDGRMLRAMLAARDLRIAELEAAHAALAERLDAIRACFDD